ncbi:twin-arginine translocase TatA/TatE family subunit [Microcella daejeonensis]|uniref:twin-arginine translocase TatA/TatE family subunit n=1 Tax=Microcella daejeonensis TaxID=2994971 RepID=UPI00227126C5|nr:twin-arginine translocase TatA/TatE family subunit [Microcella daejeonensis]WAB83472.1 twin-arginine translocase TatA/TatE family subunit [Microcella daejeonensis]
MPQLSGWTGLILLLVILLLFAAPKLPQLAKSLGQSATIFKKEIKAGKEDDDASAEAGTSTTTAPGTSAPAPQQSAAPSTGEGPDSTASK